MFSKKFKYQVYLEKYANCPPTTYVRNNSNAFRWVHKDKIGESFIPLNLLKEPPPRMLDKNDSLCMGFGLSLFDSDLNGRKRYQKVFLSKRGLDRDSRIKEMGDSIAELNIKKSDGISGHQNFETGHFTFHEFKGVSLPERIVRIVEIFDENGDFKRD